MARNSPTLWVHHEKGLEHATPEGHPERADRLRTVTEALSQTSFAGLKRVEAEPCDPDLVALAHGPNVLRQLQRARPAEGIAQIDGDTYISSGSFGAAFGSIGAAVQALEAVFAGEASNAFCAVRPPGHHAEVDTPMGFCLFNSIAIAARYAQQNLGAERVAIVDFDVHHGNGTQDIFKDDPSVFYGSSHQMPLFPGTGAASETGVGNIVNTPLKAGDGGERIHEAFNDHILPGLVNFSPDVILISAGFDAHWRDPLAGIELKGQDFDWMSAKLMEIADKVCGGRIVSLLEGGYDLIGLREGVSAHVSRLMGKDFG